MRVCVSVCVCVVCVCVCVCVCVRECVRVCVLLGVKGWSDSYASSWEVTRTMVYIRQNSTGIPETVYAVTHTDCSKSQAAAI